MSFSDIFKSSYLEHLTEFSFVDSFIALISAFIIGMFIYFIYKKTFSGVMYSRSFNASLVLLTVTLGLYALQLKLFGVGQLETAQPKAQKLKLFGIGQPKAKTEEN